MSQIKIFMIKALMWENQIFIWLLNCILNINEKCYSKKDTILASSHKHKRFKLDNPNAKGEYPEMATELDTQIMQLRDRSVCRSHANFERTILDQQRGVTFQSIRRVVPEFFKAKKLLSKTTYNNRLLSISKTFFEIS